MLDEYAVGFEFASRIWATMLPARASASGPRPIHIPEAFDRRLVERVSLPTVDNRPDTQTVALVDGLRFDRHNANTSIDAAYADLPRTLVFESINTRSNGWYSIAAIQLARMARCRVVCTMYQSKIGDLNLGAHVDEWFGAVVQVCGAKEWKISTHMGTSPMRVNTNPGDILLLPPEYEHEVRTRYESTHLVFAFLTEESIR
ncbi:JmjC domain-containing protein [Nocardia salmonicida]|uniref:JmjC domain-containing protein n=1 Tax=Nocardia salmonicida TaxID=53431 RepID=UPI0036B4ABEE